jgi:hypothetical protein
MNGFAEHWYLGCCLLMLIAIESPQLFTLKSWQFNQLLARGISELRFPQGKSHQDYPFWEAARQDSHAFQPHEAVRPNHHASHRPNNKHVS